MRNLAGQQIAIVARILVVLSATSVCFTNACGKRHESTAARIDEIFAQWNKVDSPGCSVGVSHNGNVVYEHGYGMANLALKVPITPASTFRAASISKQFTAASIMLLAQRGKLSLDDQARKHLPELPDYGSPLTIRHLLNHTAGLRDAFLILELTPPQDPAEYQTDLILRLLARHRSLNYKPGSEWMYNNGAYAMLAVIVRRVSGQSLPVFAEENIFRPLGMTSTRFQDDPTVIIPSSASNYYRDGGSWRFVPDSAARGAVGNSGLWTTTGDLLRWVQNLDNVRIGTKAMLDQMQQPTVLDGGKPVNWGIGFQIGEHSGSRYVGHGGNDRGIDNYVAWYPKQRLGIAVLCNTDEAGSIPLMHRVADLYLGGVAPPTAAAAPAPRVLSQEALQGKAGLYSEIGDRYQFLNFFVRDGQLRGAVGTGTGDSFTLVPSGENRFAIPGTDVTFEFDPGQAHRVHSSEGQTRKAFERMPSFKPSSAQLREYTGNYFSPEIDVVWSITERDSSLVIHRPARADTTIEPLTTDVFTTIGDFMRFSRNSRGAVDGFALVASGMRGLRFDRVNR